MKRDVEFLFEIGMLRFMPRQWQRFLGPQVANNSEHMFRVAWLALVIAEREGVEDTGKIVKMALVHDIAESRSSDVDYMSRQYVKRDEHAAIHDMLEDTSVEKEFLELIEEYEKRESIEAKIVKDADNLDVEMEVREMHSSGHGLAEALQPHRDNVVAKLYFTESARKMNDEIRHANPHDWHSKSPKNRVNAGDCSKKPKK